MGEKSRRHIGDGQLVYGLPKHMVGVAPLTNPNASQAQDDSQTVSGVQRAYWTVHPEPGACAACKAMEGLQYLEEPRRPHPNCKCEIRRHDMPVVSILRTLDGFGDHDTQSFAAWQKITVTITNLGPFPAGARILVDRDWEYMKTTGLLGIFESKSFEFTKFGDMPIYWQVELFYDGGDNSLLSCFIQG